LHIVWIYLLTIGAGKTVGNFSISSGNRKMGAVIYFFNTRGCLSIYEEVIAVDFWAEIFQFISVVDGPVSFEFNLMIDNFNEECAMVFV